MSFSATSNTPFGLNPVRTLTGAPWNDQLNPYMINYTVATGVVNVSLFTGDPVLITKGTPTAALAGMVSPYTTSGAGTDAMLGVFMGCKYIDTTGTVQFAKSIVSGTTIMAGTYPIAFIADDPNIIYQIQLNNSAALAVPAYNYTGQNINVGVAAAGGDTSLGISRYYGVTAALGTANAGWPLKVIRVASSAPTGVDASYAYLASTSPYIVVEVVSNNNTFSAGTSSIAFA